MTAWRFLVCVLCDDRSCATTVAAYSAPARDACQHATWHTRRAGCAALGTCEPTLPRVIAGLDPAIHPLRERVLQRMMDRPEIGFTRFRHLKCASRINPTCVVKPAGDGLSLHCTSQPSCPGRVQRALLRERNEIRDPAEKARSSIPASATARRVAPGSRLFALARSAGTRESHRKLISSPRPAPPPAANPRRHR